MLACSSHIVSLPLLETGCGWCFVAWFYYETDFFSPLSSSTSLAHCILLFCEGLLASLENGCWSILLSQRSVEIKIESETLVLLSRENEILQFRLNPQSLPFIWYIVQSNLMLLLCFWENDLMGKAVFYIKRNGHRDCIFFPSLPSWNCCAGNQCVWKQHIYFCMNY